MESNLYNAITWIKRRNVIRPWWLQGDFSNSSKACCNISTYYQEDLQAICFYTQMYT